MRERFGICKLCPDSAKYFNTKALVLCLKKKKKKSTKCCAASGFFMFSEIPTL